MEKTKSTNKTGNAQGQRLQQFCKEKAGWTRTVKEEELNSAPHCRKNLHHSHQLCLGVASAPLSGDILPTSFVPEWSTLKAHFCSSSEETAGTCLCGREL